MKDAFPRNTAAEEWSRCWIRGTSALQQTSLRKKEFFVECLGETGCGTEKTEWASRSHASHWNRGNRITGPWSTASFLYITVIRLRTWGKKDFELNKKCRVKNNFLRTRVSVDPRSLQSHKQTLLSGTTHKACCPTAQVTSSTRKFPKRR
jgi:hypothetical protein